MLKRNLKVSKNKNRNIHSYKTLCILNLKTCNLSRAYILDHLIHLLSRVGNHGTEILMHSQCSKTMAIVKIHKCLCANSAHNFVLHPKAKFKRALL